MAEEQKNSSKALKTQKKIRNVLAELLTKKKMRYITVQEIAEKANISRTTFYHYYTDVYAVYEHTEQIILNKLESIVQSLGAENETVMFRSIITYIENNSEVFRMVFSFNATARLRLMIGAMLESSLVKLWLKRADTRRPVVNETHKYLIHYHVSGCLSVISEWAWNNYSDPKEMVINTLMIANQAAEKTSMGLDEG